MKIAFNPSTVEALITPPNNKDITFDLRGRNIFARGVKFCGTDTNTWRDIKINNVSIGSNILDLRNGSNTTLTNTNGVVTINSTWRPVVDNLTSDSTTSSLSAKQGKVLKSLIDGKSNSGHTHDDRYLKLTGGTMASNALITFADSGSWGTDKGPQGARGGLYWTGQSDYAKLYAEETAGDNLDLVIQFGDDNSNGLSIRNASNVQTSYISAGGIITTKTFKGNLDWSYITNKPSSYTPSAHTHAWNSLTHSSTTENQAILTNGKANGWKLYTLNISRWDNAANNAHSHANKSVLDGITSALVNNWNVAYTFVNTITGTDTDKVINKWDEIVNFLAGITEDNKLNTLLNSKLSVYKLADNTNVGTIKNNGIYYSTTDASSDTLTNSPFNTGFALINMTSYDGGDDLRRSRLAFNAYGEIKVSDDRGLANTVETWYNVLTSKNSGISGSTIKLNGTSITVYSSSTADGRYVKKSGDTMTGVLTIDTTNFGALTIKRNDDSNGASIQFRGKSSVYGYIGLNNSTKDKQFLRWNSDTSKTYTILDTSSTYTSNGKGVINGTTITQVDNADKVDGYHASSLWRSDGATWNPSANVSLNASANGQEWSFDIRRNGYTGCYWHVWDSALSTLLKVNADNGKVYAPYNFVGNLEGNASTATALTTSAGSATLPIYFSGGKPIACTASLVFSNLSNSGNNISVTVAGLNRTLTVAYANNADTVDGYHASKFPYINNSGVWKVYGNSAAAALADNTAGLSSWAFGESRNSGITYLGILKPSTATCGISANGTIAVFGQGDTHLGIASDYSSANLQVFGGNADKIVWRKKIAFADGTGVSGTWDINISGNAASATKSEYSRSLLGRSTSGSDYDTNRANLVFAEWDTMHDNRWYLKATGCECRVAYANSAKNAANADTVDGTHLNGIFTAFGNNAHNITATIGGVTKSFLVNWAADSDKLDGYHASSSNTPWGTIPVITTLGFMDIGNDLEFHYDNTTGSDYSTALMCQGNYSNIVNLPSASGTLALTSDIPTTLPANGGNADTTDGVHITWAGELTSTSHLVAWEANGSALRDINPANVTVGNSDKLDGYHANGLLTALSNSNNGISITVGGTTKSVSNISVNYAASAGSATNSDFATNSDTIDGYHANLLAKAWSDSDITMNYVAKYNGNYFGMITGTGTEGFPNDDGSWTHVFLASYNNNRGGDGNKGNFWVTQIANKSGTTSPWIRSRAGGDNISTGWTDWVRIMTKNDVDNYYWANVKISTSANTQTQPSVNTIYANNWFRSQGDSGWYNESYGGGIWMNDSNWIKTYGGKSFYCDNLIYSSNSIKMSDILLEHTNEINSDSGIYLNFRNSGNVSLCYGGGKVGIGTATPLYELDVMGNTFTAGFGIRPYYLSDSRLLPTISPGDGYTYRCLEIGKSVAVSCIIADRVVLSNERGVLIKFNTGFDGLIVLLKDLENYGNGNGHFWVMPSECTIIRPDGSSTEISYNLISNTYDDGKSRFFVYSSKYNRWIEFYCG